VDQAILLDEVLANAWPAPLTEVVDRWQLRFGQGLDRRTNTAWAIGEPDCGLEAAVEITEDFYGRREMDVEIRTGGSTPPALFELLAARGYDERPRHPLVCVAETGALRAEAAAGFEIVDEETISPDWFAVYWEEEQGRLGSDQRAVEQAHALLRAGPECHYLSARRAGEVVAVGQAVLSRGLLVVQAIATRAERRREGGARTVLAALGELARRRGVPRMCLAVQEQNAAARPLYEAIGFGVDHRCRYLFRPAGG